VSRGATLDDRYRSTPQVVRIRLGHPKILPKRIKSARLAHPPTFGNPPDSTREGYALAFNLPNPFERHAKPNLGLGDRGGQRQAACLMRLAIFAIVARLQPVALWIDPQD